MQTSNPHPMHHHRKPNRPKCRAHFSNSNARAGRRTESQSRVVNPNEPTANPRCPASQTNQKRCKAQHQPHTEALSKRARAFTQGLPRRGAGSSNTNRDNKLVPSHQARFFHFCHRDCKRSWSIGTQRSRLKLAEARYGQVAAGAGRRVRARPYYCSAHSQQRDLSRPDVVTVSEENAPCPTILSAPNTYPGLPGPPTTMRRSRMCALRSRLFSIAPCPLKHLTPLSPTSSSCTGC